MRVHANEYFIESGWTQINKKIFWLQIGSKTALVWKEPEGAFQIK